VVLLFYTTSEVYTKFGMVSKLFYFFRTDRIKVVIVEHPLFQN